jgi:pimeloyl-ACP methyl ester carboxylesterase
MVQLPNVDQVHYTEMGRGPALVLVHALGVSTGMWTLQMPVLAQRYRVIRYDVRGHGQTRCRDGDFSIWDLAEDLRHVMDLLHVEQAAVVGISMGGLIAQAAAITMPHRVALLGLISTVGVYPDQARGGLLDRAKIAESEGMAPLVEPAIERWFTEDFRGRARASSPGHTETAPMAAESAQISVEGVEANLLASVRKMIAATSPTCYGAACRALADADLSRDLDLIRCPTLIMSGEKDQGISPASQTALKGGIARSTQIVVSDCSHMIPVERSADFNENLLNFLAMCNY